MEGSVLTIDFVRKAMEKHHHTKEVTPPTPLASEAANKVIKLDRNFTLMPGWEQCLDTKVIDTLVCSNVAKVLIIACYIFIVKMSVLHAFFFYLYAR